MQWTGRSAYGLKIGESMALLLLLLSFAGCSSPENAVENSLAFTSDNGGQRHRSGL